MEKYCPKCHKIYDNNKNNKFCLNCGTKLKTREKRKPIPPKLRHEIFVRDGYRCRECGKNNHETSLEIDHIFPLSQGGRTIEDNLQVLCTECNRAKKDDEWKDKEIEITRNALSNLENQLHEAEESLNVTATDEEMFALKAKIKDLKENKIPHDEKKLKELMQDEERINAERKAQLKENERRKNLFNKLYVQVEGELLLGVCNHFSLTESSDKDNIRLLIDKYGEQEIYTAIKLIEKELEEEAHRKDLYDKLDNTISSDEMILFVNEFSFKGSKQELLNYLVYNYTEEEINLLKVKLVKKEQERLAKLKQDKLKNDLINSLTKKELSLFSKEFYLPLNDSKIVDYLIENYSEKEIEDLRLKLIKEDERINNLRTKLLETLTPEELYLFSKEFYLPLNDSKIVDYLIENYSEKEIEDLRLKLIKKDLINELRFSLEVKQLIFLCKHFSLKQCTKNSLINHLEGCSIKTIRRAIELMDDNDGKSTMDIISNNSNDKKQNKLVKVKKILINNLLNSLTSEELSHFRDKFKLMNSSNLEVASYLVENYTEDEIEYLRKNLIKNDSNENNLSKDDLIKSLEFNLTEEYRIVLLCKYFSLTPPTKENLINHMKDSSLDNIGDAFEFMKKHAPKRKSNKKLPPSWIDEFL